MNAKGKINIVISKIQEADYPHQLDIRVDEIGLHGKNDIEPAVRKKLVVLICKSYRNFTARVYSKTWK